MTLGLLGELLAWALRGKALPLIFQVAVHVHSHRVSVYKLKTLAWCIAQSCNSTPHLGSRS